MAAGLNTVNIDVHTRLCAVIGHPVGHSLSPAMHNPGLKAAGLNYVYLAFDVTNVQGCLAGMRAMPNFRGMSVTIPHKMAVMPYLDEIDPMAQIVGCVNTITNESGRLIGSITDGLGTLRAFAHEGVSLEGRRILFIGAGGAVRAVAFAMALETRPQHITILGRTASRIHDLVQDLSLNTQISVSSGSIGEDMAASLENSDIIINGTPLGMFGYDEGKSPVPSELLRPHHVVFDMVYRPRNTQLLSDARRVGCKTIQGSEMLLQQAVLQFERWTGVPAPIEVMRKSLADALGG
jgi:shikimate dehydrogenase